MINFDPSKPKQAIISFEEIIPPQNLSKPNPTAQRAKSSKILGEDTERVRNSLKEIDVNEDYAAAIEGKKCEDKMETLARSVIGIASSSQNADVIHEHITSEGVNCLTIKSMGGMKHLITFHSLEDKESMIQSRWLERWYMELKEVDNLSTTHWRETWINIYGVPLVGWGYENFYNIGSILGKVLSVSYTDLDCANVMIITDCLFDINTKISICIEGVQYPIHISEKKQYLKSSVCPCREETQENISAKSTEQLSHSPGKSTHDVTLSFKEDKMKSHFLKETHLIGNNKNNENCAHHLMEPSNERPNTTPEINKINLDADSQCNQPHSNHYTPNKTASKKIGTAFPKPNTHQDTDNLTHQSNPNIKPPILNNNSSPNQKSPNHRTTNSKHTNSPIQISNMFGPLLRPGNSKSSSTITSGSTSCSGPLFPPGFEDTIPAQHKFEKEQKRKKKMEKKRKLKQSSSSANNNTNSPDSHQTTTHIIRVDDVINMASQLGLFFDGPISELRSRIDRILRNQKQNWDCNLS